MAARRHGHVVAGEQLLALVLEEIHRWRPCTLEQPRICQPGRRHPAFTWHYAPAMAIPKTVSFVTFDVYGTLIDWETGVYDAFAAEADRDGFHDRA